MKEREFLMSHRKRKKSVCGRATPLIEDVSIGDISVDDPEVSPTKMGEVIGHNLLLEMERNLERYDLAFPATSEGAFIKWIL